MEENLDRADENTSRLSSELQQLEKEREEAQHSLRTLENSESQIAEKADTQVKPINSILIMYLLGYLWLLKSCRTYPLAKNVLVSLVRIVYTEYRMSYKYNHFVVYGALGHYSFSISQALSLH